MSEIIPELTFYFAWHALDCRRGRESSRSKLGFTSCIDGKLEERPEPMRFYKVPQSALSGDIVSVRRASGDLFAFLPFRDCLSLPEHDNDI